MKERKITINGTNQQVTITSEQAMEYRFIAADADGELWLYEKKPKPDSINRMSFSPVPLSDCDQHGEYINIEADEWIQSATPISIVFDPDAMAEAVRSLIATRLIRHLDKPDFKKLLAEVTALIKAGN